MIVLSITEVIIISGVLLIGIAVAMFYEINTKAQRVQDEMSETEWAEKYGLITPEDYENQEQINSSGQQHTTMGQKTESGSQGHGGYLNGLSN